MRWFVGIFMACLVGVMALQIWSISKHEAVYKRQIVDLKKQLGTVDTVSVGDLISHSSIKPARGVLYDRFVVRLNFNWMTGTAAVYDTIVIAHGQTELTRELPEGTVIEVFMRPYGHRINYILYRPQEDPDSTSETFPMF